MHTYNEWFPVVQVGTDFIPRYYCFLDVNSPSTVKRGVRSLAGYGLQTYYAT